MENPIYYAVKTKVADKIDTVFRSKNQQKADFILKDLKSFGKSAWVDLEDKEGKPHPCLED